MPNLFTKEHQDPYNWRQILRTPDVQFAVGLFFILFMLVVPMPAIILDFFIVLSIALSFLIMLMSIYVEKPLQFSTFPTILLLFTLYRLALNVATTRSILLDGYTGEISQIIQSFGQFVVGGNYFVGMVIFIILVIINFIVITRGAGRVAEVGARFTLDAMPGKQMAIDAEMNTGSIDKDEAKKRRYEIEREADFYGAMDGASKFVRGDAIAGIIITLINVLIGLLLGVSEHDMSFSQSAQVFTLLTVGDGLVSQIPALIISTAAGIIVTRTGSVEGFSASIQGQLFIQPKALYVSAAFLGVMALMPGMPFAPFGLLSASFSFLGNFAMKQQRQKIQSAKLLTEEDEKAQVDEVSLLLHVDILAIEVGVGLIPIVDKQQNGEVLERIVSTRKQFAQDMGIIVPMVMVKDNIQLKSGEYQILLKGEKMGGGHLMVDYLLAMDPGNVIEPIDGIKTKEPAYGLDAVWIKGEQKENASFQGYTVVNSSTIIVTHLNKIITEHSAELIGRQEVQELIDRIKTEYPKVIEEVIGQDRLTLGDVVKVLQDLLRESVSIKDLLTVFETLADHSRKIKHPDVLVRHVRKALGRSIVSRYLVNDKELHVISLDRATEDYLVSLIVHHEEGSTSLNLDPNIAQKLLTQTAEGIKAFDTIQSIPVVICGALIRLDFKKLLHRFIPGVVILAFDEIPHEVIMKNIGTIRLS